MPVPRHHQRDAHLLAVSPMVAAVAAPGQPIAVGLALEVRARHVIQQQVVVELEQLSQALLRWVSSARLCGSRRSSARYSRSSLIRSAGTPEKILQRRAPIPVLGDVQLARRLAQSRNHQDRRHRRPRHPLASFDQTHLAETIEASARHSRQPSHTSPKRRARSRRICSSRTATGSLGCPGSASNSSYCSSRPGDPQGQRAGPRPSLCIELAKLRHRLLHHSAAATHRAHQTPVAVRLAVLANRRVSQIHRRESSIAEFAPNSAPQQPRRVGTTRPFSNAAQSISSAKRAYPPSAPAATSAKIAQKNSCAHKLRKLG